MHAQDELYDRLRGPAENMTVLATAFSDPETDGSGENEPMLMGPVISASAKKTILGLIEDGVREGATLALDGRGVKAAGEGAENGYYIGPTVFTEMIPPLPTNRYHFVATIFRFAAEQLPGPVGVSGS